MELITNILFLVIGFILLIKGADFFVDGSASVARYFKVPGVIIGLTIVAMGTSAPELAVSVSAGLSGSNEIAVSNVVGSNIFNLLLILGVSGSLHPIVINVVSFVDLGMLLGVSMIAYAFVCSGRRINRVEGAVMILLYAAYTAYAIVR